MSVPSSKADEHFSTSCNDIIPAKSMLNLCSLYINGSHLNSSVNGMVHDENSPSKYNLKSAFHDYYRLISEDLRHVSTPPYHTREVISELELNELVLNTFYTESFPKQRPNNEQHASLQLLLLKNIVLRFFCVTKTMSRKFTSKYKTNNVSTSSLINIYNVISSHNNWTIESSLPKIFCDIKRNFFKLSIYTSFFPTLGIILDHKTVSSENVKKIVPKMKQKNKRKRLKANVASLKSDRISVLRSREQMEYFCLEKYGDTISYNTSHNYKKRIRLTSRPACFCYLQYKSTKAGCFGCISRRKKANQRNSNRTIQNNYQSSMSLRHIKECVNVTMLEHNANENKTKRKHYGCDTTTDHFEEPCEKRPRSSSLDSQNNQYNFIRSHKSKERNTESLATKLSGDDFHAEDFLHGYYKYIPSVTFDMEPVYNGNALNGSAIPVVPQDIPGYLVPLCNCSDCEKKTDGTYQEGDDSQGIDAASSTEDTILSNRRVQRDSGYCEETEDETHILDAVEKEIDYSYRSLSDIIDNLSMSDFDIPTCDDESIFTKAEDIYFECHGTNEPNHNLTRQNIACPASFSTSKQKNDTKFGEIVDPSLAFSTCTPSTNIFPCKVYEMASLSVPQPNILKHSTDPRYPFVCFEENNNNSMAAQRLIETTELKQIIPPKPLDNIVPTTLVSTCGIVAASKVLNKGFSNHISMTTKKSSDTDFLRQENYVVQELHTIYGNTSDKLYNKVM